MAPERHRSPSLQEPPRTVVVGGGWAGLAAATELTRRHIPVLLLEASRQLGGRARALPFGPYSVDNGQHILIHAYNETRRLIELVNPRGQPFLRKSIRLDIQGEGESLRLAAPALPAPLHLAAGLASARGLSPGERWHALRLSAALLLSGFRLDEETTLSAFLERHRQPPRLVRLLWEPLCLATLNTPLQEASARLFLRVLHDTFARRRSDSDLLLPRVDLGRAFPEPALHFIERHRGHVRLNSRVAGLELREGAVAKVVMSDGNEVEADRVVLAVPPTAAERLLAPHPSLRPIADRLGQLAHEPITTLYLRYPEEVRAPSEMVGMVGGLGQWLFDRRINGQPGLMAVVISGPGPHEEMERAALSGRVARELAQRFPHWPAPLESLVIREKRATMSCTVGFERLRPGHTTPVRGLWLAGDHTDTGYPSTLEGAVRSGVECARLIAAEGGPSS